MHGGSVSAVDGAAIAPIRLERSANEEEAGSRAQATLSPGRVWRNSQHDAVRESAAG
jgi:hypothetical protein